MHVTSIVHKLISVPLIHLKLFHSVFFCCGCGGNVQFVVVGQSLFLKRELKLINVISHRSEFENSGRKEGRRDGDKSIVWYKTAADELLFKV